MVYINKWSFATPLIKTYRTLAVRYYGPTVGYALVTGLARVRFPVVPQRVLLFYPVNCIQLIT